MNHFNSTSAASTPVTSTDSYTRTFTRTFFTRLKDRFFLFCEDLCEKVENDTLTVKEAGRLALIIAVAAEGIILLTRLF